jgi:isoamylase
MQQLGAHWDGEATTFALASAHAEAVELCLFESRDSAHETKRLPLARGVDGSFAARVGGVGPGQLYGYRVHGPWAPQQGQRFNAEKLLVDPWARAVAGSVRWHESLSGENRLDSAPYMPRSLVVDPRFDWGDDRAPRVPWRETVLYEVHVRGMTQLHPDVPESERGRYLGLAAPAVVEHLRALGVTTLSLLPVQHSAPDPHVASLGLENYWGYGTLAYFAPDARFASGDLGEQVREFREMVRRLHRTGLEVLIDVVYNHTPEADSRGPLYSLRGVDNATYYRLDPAQPSEYEDWSGCGNTLDLRQPITRQLVLDSLRHWVSELHVDGFRFDLAPALARDPIHFDAGAAFLSELLADPVLGQVKLVAEPWDPQPGGYQLGAFPAPFREWNDRFRDTTRRFWRGDRGTHSQLATRLAGSQDVFGSNGRTPLASVNFVTCHDGFTLEDLVRYAQKHNEANGEQNRDGAQENWSRNWGVEGPTDDPRVVRLRERAKRNLVVTLAFALGVPMLSHGDELGRTQSGNNNAYCQDGPRTWVDWQLDARRREFLEFVRRAFALRRATPALSREGFWSEGDVAWLGADATPLTSADWQDPQRSALAVYVIGPPPALLLLNAGSRTVAFQLPAPPAGSRWRGLLSSACHPPRVRGERVRVAPYACLWLGSEGGPAHG